MVSDSGRKSVEDYVMLIYIIHTRTIYSMKICNIKKYQKYQSQPKL